MPIHTNFKRGQRIRVIMKPSAWGKHIIGKYQEALSGFIVLEGNRRIKLGDVRATIIERGGDRVANAQGS